MIETESPELIRLRQENSELVAKVSSLKSQLDMTNVVSTQLETVCNKNIALEKEIRDVQGKYDDLAKRLKISVEKNNELQSQLESFHLETKSNESQEITNLKNKIIECQKQINEIDQKKNSIAQKLENALQISENRDKKLIELLTSAEAYFDQKISTPEELICRFSQKDIHQTPAKPTTNESADLEMIALCQEIKKLKKQNRKLLARNEGLNHELQFQIQKNKDILDAENRKFQDSLSSARLEIDKQHALIKELTYKNNDLASTLATQKLQLITENKGIHSQLHEEINDLGLKLDERDASIKQLSDNLSNLRKDYNTLNNKYKSVQNSNKLLKDELSESNRIRVELKFTHDHLQVKYDEISQQLNNSENRYLSKESELKGEQEKNRTLNIQINQIRSENAKIMKLLSEEQIKADNLQQQKDRLEKELEAAKSFGSTQANSVNILNQKVKDLSEEIAKKDKEESERRQLIINDEKKKMQALAEPLSPSIFEMKELPQDIQTLILDIVRNTTLRNSAKVKSVMSVVVQYYNKIITDQSSEIDVVKTEHSKLVKSLDDLLNVLNRNLGIEISADELIHSEQTLPFISNAFTNRDYKLQEDQKYINERESKILEIFSMLNVENETNAISALHELFNTIANLQESQKDLRKQYKSIIKEAKQKDAECLAKLNDFEKQATEISEKTMKLESENRDYALRIKNLEQQLIEDQNEHSQELKMLAESHAIQIAECEKAVKASNERTREEIQKRAEVEEKLRYEVTEREKVQRTLQLMRSSKKKHEEEASKLMSEKKTIENAMQERLLAERQTIVTRYETHISQMKEQIDEMKYECDHKDENISSLEEQLSELMKKYQNLQLENQKTLLQIKSNEEQYQRELKLIESQLTTKMLTKEKDFNNQLDISKRQTESIKRALIGRIGVEFCSLFNTTEEINEENFEKFIKLLRNKFDELMSENSRMKYLFSMKNDDHLIHKN